MSVPATAKLLLQCRWPVFKALDAYCTMKELLVKGLPMQLTGCQTKLRSNHRAERRPGGGGARAEAGGRARGAVAATSTTRAPTRSSSSSSVSAAAGTRPRSLAAGVACRLGQRPGGMHVRDVHPQHRGSEAVLVVGL